MQGNCTFCVKQAEVGGENQLVDGLSVIATLPSDVREALRDPRWRWTNPLTRQASEAFAVLTDDPEAVRWWRMSLLNRDIGSVAIANAFEDAINESDQKVSVTMQPGDVLVTDNTRMLHNRSAFQGERKLFRARFW